MAICQPPLEMPKQRIKRTIDGSDAFIEERIEGAGDTFLVSFLDGYLYYSPLATVCILLDAFGTAAVQKYFTKAALLPNEQSLIDDLAEQSGIFNLAEMRQDPSAKGTARWTPTAATFSNTQKCTLRCKHCYAAGGRLDDADIPWPVAKAAIDLIINNAIERSLEPSIRFLGEGEATASWRAFQSIIEYFKAQCKSVHAELVFDTSTVTNLEGEIEDVNAQTFVGCSRTA